MNPMDLKRGIDMAVNAAIERHQEARRRRSRRTEEIAQVGTISANGEKAIGDMIAEAMQKVGNEGVITVEEAKTARNRTRLSSKACSSTAAISRPTSSPTPRR